jgi:hypothetical protein
MKAFLNFKLTSLQNIATYQQLNTFEPTVTMKVFLSLLETTLVTYTRERPLLLLR